MPPVDYGGAKASAGIVGSGAILLEPARFPGRAPIDAYGNGGFRFAGMSHRGSILVMPGAIEAWDVSTAEDISALTLARIIDAASTIKILLIGVGATMALIPRGASAALEGAGLYPELMPTGAAVRTFNVLLSEGRAVAAALIAVGATD